MDTPQHSAPSAPDVIGRSDLANHAVAESLRLALLSDDDVDTTVAPITATNEAAPASTTSLTTITAPSSSAPTILPHSNDAPQVDWRRMHAERALQMAYSREYTPKEGRHKRSRGDGDGNGYGAGHRGGRKYSRRKGDCGNVFLALDKQQEGEEGVAKGQDPDGAHDNEYGELEVHRMLGAQVLGVGVIGHARSSGSAPTEAAYNINLPAPVAEHDWHLRPVPPGLHDADSAQHRYTIGPHNISFAQGLSIMSKEHPARVWNSLLHSLDADKKPRVQYAYEPVMTEEGDDAYICEMTVTLPGFEEAAAGKNPHEGEDAISKGPTMERNWAGEPALTKTTKWSPSLMAQSDASNNALRAALLQGMYGWIRGDEASIAVTPGESEPSGDIEPSDRPAETDATGATESALQASREDAAPDAALDSVSTSTALNRMVAACTSAQQELGLSSHRLTCSVELGFAGMEVACTLRIGSEPSIQTYTSSPCADLGSAMEAAAAAAIECNVEAYLRWLPTNVHLEPAGAFTIPQKDEVDWIEQLYNFCRMNDMRPPRIAQVVNNAEPGNSNETDEGDEARTKFKGKIILEDEEYHDETSYDTVIAARQSIARSVFVDYFGQSPVRLEKREQNEYGRRGGRGRARVGRRGRY